MAKTNESKAAESLAPITEGSDKFGVTSPPETKLPKRRESTLHYSSTDNANVPWQCETVGLSTDELAAVAKDNALDNLCNALANSNEALHDQLLNWEEFQLSTTLSQVNLGTAVNWKFDELREHLKRVVKDYGTLQTQILDNAKTITELRDALKASQIAVEESDKERGAVYAENLDLNTKLQAALAIQSSLPRTLSINPLHVDITVPKQYAAQFKAMNLQVFEGTTNLDSVYNYIKALEFHIDTLEYVFTDSQRIEYAISFLRGSARKWAKEEWRKETFAPTWEGFLRAFKARWVPANAHVHLVNKLEEMELRRGSVDAFNDKFRGILELLHISDLRTCRESDQYYKIYYNKIKDSALKQALLLRSLATPGGLDLHTLMDYTSKLMLALPAHRPPTTPQSTTPQPNNAKTDTSKPKKSGNAQVNNVEDGSQRGDSTIYAIAASTASPRSSSTGGTSSSGDPRTCYSCNATDHLLRDCPTRKQFWEKGHRRSWWRSQEKGEEDSEDALSTVKLQFNVLSDSNKPIILSAAVSPMTTNVQPSSVTSLRALVDSGASHCFIHPAKAHQLATDFAIPIVNEGFMQVSQASTVDDRQQRRRITLPLVLNHQVPTTVTFTLYPLANYDVLLGMDWLTQHSVLVDARHKTITIENTTLHTTPEDEEEGEKVGREQEGPTETGQEEQHEEEKPSVAPLAAPNFKEYIGVHNIPANVKPRQTNVIRKGGLYGIERVAARTLTSNDRLYMVRINAVEVEPSTAQQLAPSVKSQIINNYPGIFDEPKGTPPTALPKLQITVEEGHKPPHRTPYRVSREERSSSARTARKGQP
ncbi:hypothetical protein BJ508DRAFT_314839 [Ascobolus immersus RN42]|uniref:CCHC-type domain-containing protein n=1 Tax=Ascobolus immersus RN42 TaxID=1160509 RepID=A0A3N4HKA2_ASCIM|nr:hypothetical protein BJ508DRAFT_314839 [Ascobolus immersus RN42]